MDTWYPSRFDILTVADFVLKIFLQIGCVLTVQPYVNTLYVNVTVPLPLSYLQFEIPYGTTLVRTTPLYRYVRNEMEIITIFLSPEGDCSAPRLWR